MSWCDHGWRCTSCRHEQVRWSILGEQEKRLGSVEMTCQVRRMRCRLLYDASKVTSYFGVVVRELSHDAAQERRRAVWCSWRRCSSRQIGVKAAYVLV